MLLTAYRSAVSKGELTRRCSYLLERTLFVLDGARSATRRSGAGRGAPASDGDGGSGGAKAPGLDEER